MKHETTQSQMRALSKAVRNLGREILLSLGIRTNGVTQIVWLVGPYAFKFPAFINRGWRLGLHGILSNYQEATLWACVNSEGYEFERGMALRDDLMPVLFHLWGLVLVMRRGKPIEAEYPWNIPGTSEFYVRLSPTMRQVVTFETEEEGDTERLARVAQTYSDIKDDNLVYWNGTIRFCDYGGSGRG